jgi:hypothetical protein
MILIVYASFSYGAEAVQLNTGFGDVAYVQLAPEEVGFCSLDGCTINGSLIINGNITVTGDYLNVTVVNVTYNITDSFTVNGSEVCTVANGYCNQSFTDTNETVRMNNLVNTDCSDNQFVNGTFNNGSVICGTVLSSADNLGNHIATQNITNVTSIVGKNQTYLEFDLETGYLILHV